VRPGRRVRVHPYDRGHVPAGLVEGSETDALEQVRPRPHCPASSPDAGARPVRRRRGERPDRPREGPLGGGVGDPGLRGAVWAAQHQPQRPHRRLDRLLSLL